MSMYRTPSNRGGQSFLEYALMLVLVSIVVLAILLIVGDDLRVFINDLFLRWFPVQNEAIHLSELYM